MSEPRTNQDATRDSAGTSAEPVRYLTNHVVAVVDTPAQLSSAVAGLTAAGFRESEIDFASGRAAGDALDASTGRTGLADLVVRIAERLGVADGEMRIKDHYEEALRDDRFVASVLAPSEERRDLAAQILRDHGANFIHYFGRFTIEAMYPRGDQ